MPKRKTNEEFLKEVKGMVGDEYTFLEEYKTAISKIKVIHKKCEHIYEVTPSKFLSGRRCPKCAGNKKKTNDQFKFQLSLKTKGKYELLEEYKAAKIKVKIKHNKCGYIYYVLPNSILTGHGCPKCFGTPKKTQEQFANEILNILGCQYKVLGEYKTNKEKILMQHKKCNYKWKALPTNLIKGHGCPLCANRLLKTNEQFQKEVFKIVGNEYTFLEDYIGREKKIKVKHNKCNHEYRVMPSNFLSRGNRCPKCGFQGTSRLEQEVIDYIKEIVDDKIIENDRTILNGKEIDILIPSKNIGIELNGLYWHSNKYKSKNAHLEKTLMAKEKGIQLVHIFEDEWIAKQELIKKELIYILNINKKKCIYNYKIKKITQKSDEIEFLNENHIQGVDKTSDISYGMYFKNELISLMSFVKIEQEKINAYKLLRHAEKYAIENSFKKLLDFFIKNENNVDEIYAYADLRWICSNDNIYLQNKFEYNSILPPQYSYIIKRKRIEPHFYCEIEKITLSNINDAEEFYKIYDCGHLEYKLSIIK